MPSPPEPPREPWVGRGRRTDGALFARAVLQHFRGERIGLRAAALTYLSIFALVPLVTVSLVLLVSLHQTEFAASVHAFIREVLAPGVRDSSAALLERFLHAASSRAASSLSLATLALTAGTLLRGLDVSLNELWGVRKQRPWALRLFHYGLALTLGPLLLAVSLAGTYAARAALVLARVPAGLFYGVAVAAPVLALTLLYAFAPNAPVRLRSAFAGGLVAGIGWTVAKYGYARFAAHTFQYNLLYGSLGAAPLFLVWVYLSWLLVLFGARLAYAVQHAAYRDTWPLYELHPLGRELLAGRTAQVLAQAWREGLLPMSLGNLSRRLSVPVDTVLGVVEPLAREGLLRLDGKHGVHLAKSPDVLTLADAVAAVRGAVTLPQLQPLLEKAPSLRQLEAELVTAAAQVQATLSVWTWTALANLEAAPPAGSASLARSPKDERNP